MNPDNIVPTTPKIRLDLAKYKVPLIVVLLAVLSLVSLGVIVNNEIDKREIARKESGIQVQKKEGDPNLVSVAGAPVVEGGVTQPIYNDDGSVEYYTYMYDGTLIDHQNPANDTYVGPSEPGYEAPAPNTFTDAGKANAYAIQHPGETVYLISGNGGTKTEIISDGKTTYSPSAYKNAYPTIAPTEAPNTTTNKSSLSDQLAPGNQSNTSTTKALTKSDAISEALKNPGKEYCFNDYCYISDGKDVYYPEQYKALKDPGNIYCDKNDNTDCAVSDGKNIYSPAAYSKLYPSGFTSPPNPTAVKSNPGITSQPTPNIYISRAVAAPTAYPSGFTSFADSKTISPVLTATSAPDPSETRTNVSFSAAGLGNNTALGQNPNPIRPQFLQMQVLDQNDQVVKEGIIPLSTAFLGAQPTGNTGFQQLLSLGNNLTAGNYKTRVRLDNTLWKTIDTNLTPGTTTTLPQLKLTSGDINQDNIINLLDYNLIMKCLQTKKCSNSLQADLNLDGILDEIDLNLLYVGFTNRIGE